jgi:uncharacterized RDD family membrane protein YckC
MATLVRGHDYRGFNEVADERLRAMGFIIDALLLGLLAILALALFGQGGPLELLVGQFIAGVLMGSYWLLRDVTGASLGKKVAGTRVVLANGDEAPTKALILRNVRLCVGPFLMVIPILGFVLFPAVMGLGPS